MIAIGQSTIFQSANLPDRFLYRSGRAYSIAHCLRAGVRQAECFGLGSGALHLPAIDHDPLDQPHGGGAIGARAVDERGRGLLRPDHLHELVGGFRIGLGAVERHVVVPKPGRLGRGAVLLHVGAGLLRLAQVDYGHESHFPDFRHGVGGNRAGARHGCFDPGKILDALAGFLGHLLGEGHLASGVSRTNQHQQGGESGCVVFHRHRLYELSHGGMIPADGRRQCRRLLKEREVGELEGRRHCAAHEACRRRATGRLASDSPARSEPAVGDPREGPARCARDPIPQASTAAARAARLHRNARVPPSAPMPAAHLAPREQEIDRTSRPPSDALRRNGRPQGAAAASRS